MKKITFLLLTVVIAFLTVSYKSQNETCVIKLYGTTTFSYDSTEWRLLNDYTEIDSTGCQYVFTKKTSPVCTLRVAFADYIKLYASENRDPLKTNSKKERDLYEKVGRDKFKSIKNFYLKFTESSYKDFKTVTIETKLKKGSGTIDKSKIPIMAAAFYAFDDYYSITITIENAIGTDKKGVDELLKSQIDKINK